MADEPNTDDTPEVETPEAETSEVETPEAKPEDTNYATQIADLTERVNTQGEQIEAQAARIAALEEENADLIENITTDQPEVTDAHDDGDDFLGLFN